VCTTTEAVFSISWYIIVALKLVFNKAPSEEKCCQVKEEEKSRKSYPQRKLLVYHIDILGTICLYYNRNIKCLATMSVLSQLKRLYYIFASYIRSNWYTLKSISSFENEDSRIYVYHWLGWLISWSAHIFVRLSDTLIFDQLKYQSLHVQWHTKLTMLQPCTIS
jgi:hypothetical protein